MTKSLIRDDRSDTATLVLPGKVRSGVGEACDFITMPGYMKQFAERLGYKPFA
jgi:riboflavin kinase